MLNNRKGQMFTMLLALFTIIILSTALFYLSQKSAEFDGSIGKDAYGVSKLYHANNKLLLFFESLAGEDLEESVTAILKSDTSKECGKADGFPIWKYEDKDCTPDFRDLIEVDFNNRFKDKLSLLEQERLFSYRSAYGFTESFSKLGWDIFTKKWGTEVFALVRSKDSPKDIYFAVIPDEDVESVHIVGDDVWVLEMGDVNSGLLIARVEQVPSFRINTEFPMQDFLQLQALPNKMVQACDEISDDQLKVCIDEAVKDMKDMAWVTDVVTNAVDRMAKVQMTIIRFDEVFTLRFAVKIPAQGLFVFKDLIVSQGNQELPLAFSLGKQDPLTIKATLLIPSRQGLDVRLCTQTKEQDAPKICPVNEIIFEDGKQKKIGSHVATDGKSIAISHNWAAFPKDKFDFWLEAQRDGVTIKSEITQVFITP